MKPITSELSLRQAVTLALTDYFRSLEGEPPRDLFALVSHEVEAPLLEMTLELAGGNQSKAAQMLGISRGTFRTKLAKHGLL